MIIKKGSLLHSNPCVLCCSKNSRVTICAEQFHKLLLSYINTQQFYRCLSPSVVDGTMSF